MNQKQHPLYQKILEQLLELDKREFQLPIQQRLVTAMNYLHNQKPSEEENGFKI